MNRINLIVRTVNGEFKVTSEARKVFKDKLISATTNDDFQDHKNY